MSVDAIVTPAPRPSQAERPQPSHSPREHRRDTGRQAPQQQSSSSSEDRPRSLRRLSATSPAQETRNAQTQEHSTETSFRRHLSHDTQRTPTAESQAGPTVGPLVELTGEPGEPGVIMPLNEMPVDGEATPDGSAAAPALLALSLDIAEDLALDGEVATLPAAVQALLAEDDGEADLVQLLAELFPQLISQLEAQGFVIGDASDEPGEHLLRDDEGDIIGVMIGDQLYPVQLQVENGEAAPLQAAQVGSSAAPVMLSGKTPAQANVASTVPQESNRPVRDASAAAPAPLLAAAPVTGEAMSQVVLPVSEASSLEGQQGLASWQTNTSGSIDISRLTSSTSAEPPAPQASNEAERAVEHQIKRALIQQMANGDRSMTLRLTPPHLGTVRIEIVEQRGMLTVRFSAEDDRVRQALERQLPQLRQDLRASDAPVSSVRMDDHQSGWQHDQQQRHNQAQSRDGNHNGGRFRLDDEEVDSDGNSADTPSTAPSASLGGSVSESAVDARA